MDFKWFYYFFEDKWYAFLDIINKIIPIYKVIDPIDTVVPSFVLFLLFLFFVFVSAAYFFESSSPYEVVLTVFDAKTGLALPEAMLSGMINEQIFSETTDSSGKAFLKIEGAQKNVYELALSIFFGEEETFDAVVSAKKKGYSSIESKKILLESKSASIRLMPIELTDTNFPDRALVELIDSDSKEAIVQATSVIKFKCGNKIIQEKIVRDSDDGSLDGEFALNEDNCQFVVTEAIANGYESSSEEVILPKSVSKHSIELNPRELPSTGTAKISVVEEGTSIGLAGIEIKFLNSSGLTMYSDRTDSSGVLSKNVAPGTYKIIASSSDGNFYPINSDEGKSISVSLGAVSSLALSMRRIAAGDSRIIFLRIIDSADNSRVSGARIFAQRISTDGSGKVYSSGAAALFCGNNCLSDSNGLLEARGLSRTDEGKIVIAVEKSGYIFKLIKPVLFKFGDGPQEIVLTKADFLNSGSAKIRVKSNPGAMPLAGARAFLFADSNELGISRISLNESGVFTDSRGEAFYSGLPGYPNGRYSASAVFEGISSGFSPVLDIDVNQLGVFDLNINLSASFIEIELVDFTGVRISNLDKAIVNLFSVDPVSGFVGLVPLERLALDSVRRVFVSSGYERSKNFFVSVDLDNYASNYLEVQNLVAGSNRFFLTMYPLSVLDKNVNVFFNGLYKNAFDLSRGTKALFIERDNLVRAQEKGYYVKMDSVISKDLNYLDLFSMLRGTEKISLSGIAFKPSLFFSERGLYVCDSVSKFPVNDDNFFIQTNPACVKSSESARGAQAGIHWSGALRKGTYSLSPEFVFMPSASDGDTIQLKYGAKEKHLGGFSEAEGTASFRIGSAICLPEDPACSGIYFKVVLNNASTGSEGFAFDSAAKRFTKNARFVLNSGAPNSIKVSIYNNSRQALSGVRLVAYSFSGINNIGSFAFSGSGNLLFEQENRVLSKELSSSLSIASLSYSNFVEANVFPEKINSSDYLVLVAYVGSDKYLIFFDTKTPAKTLSLSGAKFLSGVMDQVFDGEVFANPDGIPADIARVDLKVKLNCSDSSIVSNAVSNLSVSKNYFKATINGIYSYKKDCIVVDIVPVDSSFASLHKVIYAGSGGTLDPSLACIDTRFSAGFGDSSKIDLEWRKETNLVLSNRCSAPVSVRVETGLVCNNCVAELAPNESKNFSITGINTGYNPGASNPNFTDLLGFFPVFVKARFSGSGKKFAVAGKLEIHLRNSEECYAISKDAFDLLENSSLQFSINNSCQYTAFGDYFVPKAYLSAVGVDLNDARLKYNYIDFNYLLSVAGGSYATTYSKQPNKAYLRFVVDPKNLQRVLGTDFDRYTGVRLSLKDLNGTTEKLFFKWVDLKTLDGNYGAKIDGNILVTYRNGRKEVVSPKVNFELSASPACSCNGVIGSDTNYCSAVPEPSKQYCEINKETSPGFEDEDDTNFYNGIVYNLFPRGNVAFIDFNVVGNKDLNHLAFSAILIVDYDEDVPVTVINRTSAPKQFNLGAFRIYPVEGMTFILKDLSYGGEDFGVSVKEAFCRKKLEGLAWNESNLIYWAAPFFANYDISQEVCIKDSNFLFRTPGALVSSLPSSAVMNSAHSALNWLGSDNNYGLWSSIKGVFDSTEAIVFAKNSSGFTQKTVSKSLINTYLPFCVVDVSRVRNADGSVGLNLSANECESMPIVCSNSVPRVCELTKAQKLGSFFDENYLSVVNPIVEINAVNVRSNNGVLSNGAVAIWISGNMLKARFLGDDYPGFNDKSIDLSLVDSSASGIQYAIINIKDYVNKGRTKSS